MSDSGRLIGECQHGNARKECLYCRVDALERQIANSVSTAADWLPLNINTYVRVKLTNKGREIYREKYEELRQMHMPHRPPKEDKDGWSEWQLWCLIQTFGSQFGISSEAPLETEIQVRV